MPELQYIINDRKYHFKTAFDTETGFDPFMASFPHLIDVGVMGHCLHGKLGLCAKAGIQCYQSGLTIQEPNMREACPECEKKNLCMGGCPLMPEIVLCDRAER